MAYYNRIMSNDLAMCFITGNEKSEENLDSLTRFLFHAETVFSQYAGDKNKLELWNLTACQTNGQLNYWSLWRRKF